MKKVIILILIAIAFASAKDYTKIFMNLIDNLENCEFSKDTTTELFGRNLLFGCNEDTVEIYFKDSGMVINSISINTIEYYNGIKVTAYRFFGNSDYDIKGKLYKGYYVETFIDELNVTVYDVEYRLGKDLDGAKIYTYFRQKMNKDILKE